MSERIPATPFETDFTLTAVGRIVSDYPDKFGVPRQPGLAPAGRAVLHMLPPFDDPHAVRAVMMIEITGQKTLAVIQALRGLPEVHALHTTNGAWDLVAEIHADNLVEFERVLRGVRAMDGVSKSETSLLLTTL